MHSRHIEEKVTDVEIELSVSLPIGEETVSRARAQCVKFGDDYTWIVRALLVPTDWRSLGIGSALLNRVKELLTDKMSGERNRDQFRLLVQPVGSGSDFAAKCAFFVERGFRDCGWEPNSSSRILSWAPSVWTIPQCALVSPQEILAHQSMSLLARDYIK